MAADADPLFDLELVGDVAIARVLHRQIRHPAPAQELGAGLAAVADVEGHRKILIDLGLNNYLGSTAFAALLNVARKVQALGGEVRICGLHPDVQTGANILGLGRVIPTYPDRRAALSGF